MTSDPASHDEVANRDKVAREEFAEAADEEEASRGLPGSLDDLDLYREFAFECGEHLETIEDHILRLGDSPDDVDLTNEILRPIHSVKGGAGFLSLTGLNRLAHDTETLLDRFRQKEIPVTSRAIEVCLRSVDALKRLIANLSRVCEAADPASAYNDIEPVVFGPVRREIRDLLENPDGVERAAGAQAAPEFVPPRAVAPRAAPRPPRLDADLANEEYASKGLPEVLDPEDLELHQRFVFQSNEHLETIEEKILRLESAPDDEELIAEIFRAIHSIKGDSGFLRLRGIGRLAHDTETLLDRCRKKTMQASSRVVEICLQSVDALKRMIANLGRFVESPDRDPEKVDIVVFGPIRESIRNLLEDPDLAAVADEREPSGKPEKLGEILVRAGELAPEQLEEALEIQNAPLGEILVQTGAASPDTIAKALDKQRQTAGDGPSAGASAIKVGTEKIDLLVNLVGELVIIEAQVAQMAHRSAADNGPGDPQILEKSLSQLDKITKELQDRSMALRMTPIKRTFQRMTRLVRDSSAKTGKKVNLVISGEDTELDKTIVEQIGDPLVHMLRNCMDHGIEDAATREANGKPEVGTINLDAFYQGDQIVIQVKDDGRGLDRARIIEKAVENGLLEPGADPPDAEAFNLIFAPGFSTANEVTDISGRGVGMDVVRRNVEKLRGKVDVDSETGKGTTVRISLPLTLAIIDGMVVRVGDEEYIIPTMAIREALRPQRDQIATVAERGEMVNVRGKLIPLVRIHRLWNIKPKVTDPCDSLVVIVENNGKVGCLMVDELVGRQQIVIKSLGEPFSNVRGIAGATILGNGRVGLIVDVGGILASALQ
ncbi:MAG TPA: chemotaxis protein CheA [Sumerlaeia bacterium]|nr:chemotaxis protein CheA [Sumerlaeia bacterium]